MEHARNVYRLHVDATKENEVFNESGGDLDKYVYLACSSKERGCKCRKCGRNTCKIEMLQTRSADEGMSAVECCSYCKTRKIIS